MTTYHEPVAELDQEARDLHRALSSLKEEIEAIDWYHQRVVTCGDLMLKKVLAHNRDEEIEHACMTLEWLRRSVPEWDVQLTKYLYSEATDITEVEASHTSSTPSLGVGSLKSTP
jgi:hypothetical protein